LSIQPSSKVPGFAGIMFIKVSSRYDYNVSSGLHYGRLTGVAYFLASINIDRLS